MGPRPGRPDTAPQRRSTPHPKTQWNCPPGVGPVRRRPTGATRAKKYLSISGQATLAYSAATRPPIDRISIDSNQFIFRLGLPSYLSSEPVLASLPHAAFRRTKNPRSRPNLHGILYYRARAGLAKFHFPLDLGDFTSLTAAGPLARVAPPTSPPPLRPSPGTPGTPAPPSPDPCPPPLRRRGATPSGSTPPRRRRPSSPPPSPPPPRPRPLPEATRSRRAAPAIHRPPLVNASLPSSNANPRVNIIKKISMTMNPNIPLTYSVRTRGGIVAARAAT